MTACATASVQPEVASRQTGSGGLGNRSPRLSWNRYANVLVLQPGFKLDCRVHEMCRMDSCLCDLARRSVRLGRANAERQADGGGAFQRRPQADDRWKIPASMSKVRS